MLRVVFTKHNFNTCNFVHKTGVSSQTEKIDVTQTDGTGNATDGEEKTPQLQSQLEDTKKVEEDEKIEMTQSQTQQKRRETKRKTRTNRVAKDCEKILKQEV